jgi:rod shape-determining protein MreD
LFDGRFGPYFLIFLLFLAQNSLNYLFMGHLPPLMLIGVIYYSLKKGPRFGIALALLAGALADLFGQGALGFYMAQYAVVAALSGFASSKIFKDSLMAEIFLPAAAAYLCALSETRSFSAAFQPWALIGTVLFSPLLFYCLQRSSSRRSGAWRR